MSEILSVHLYQVQSDAFDEINPHNQLSFVPSFLIHFSQLFPSTANIDVRLLNCRRAPL